MIYRNVPKIIDHWAYNMMLIELNTRYHSDTDDDATKIELLQAISSCCSELVDIYKDKIKTSKDWTNVTT